jgi:hypothetical protein
MSTHWRERRGPLANAEGRLRIEHRRGGQDFEERPLSVPGNDEPGAVGKRRCWRPHCRGMRKRREYVCDAMGVTHAQRHVMNHDTTSS